MNWGGQKTPLGGGPSTGGGANPPPPKDFWGPFSHFWGYPSLKGAGGPQNPPKKGKKFHFFKGGDNSQLVKLRGGSRPDPLVPKIGILQHF